MNVYIIFVSCYIYYEGLQNDSKSMDGLKHFLALFSIIYL